MKKLLLLILLFVCSLAFSQEEAWVYFTDKPNSATFLSNPLTMLSQRALDRRTRQSIALDNKDVPVDLSYINQVENAVGVTVKAKSKWLNAVHVRGSETDIKALKTSFSFIDSIDFADKNIAFRGVDTHNVLKPNKFEVTTTNFNYGGSVNQIEMLKGDFLHQQNFTGNGMLIAVFDAGFPNVNTFSAFRRIRDNNQILGGYDFVNRNTNFYTGISHGTSVLSTMAGFVNDSLVGTAPDANYYLFITEDATSETPLEESLWVEAAERADSLGVDILNTSLGYTTFDDARYNYTYADMNGTTTFITRGADLAFSRGMIVVNSAGNEGDDPWHYIGAPADGFNVLSIGAVDAVENITGFSSFGPTFDGRIKPDANAKGGGTTVINSSGIVSTSSGTSFSSPVICGVIACLWQAYPNKTNAEIIQMIKESGDLYATPTDHEGYGIPNFQTAFNTLDIADYTFDKVKFFPNPVKDILNITIPLTDKVSIIIFDVLGKIVFQDKNSATQSINLSFLKKGIYLMKMQTENQSKTFKLIKQ